MRLVLGSLLVTWALLLPVFPQGGSGRIKGEVWYRPFINSDNSFESVAVPNCDVVFRSPSSGKKVVSSGDGHFDVELPAGSYDVSTNCSTKPSSVEYHPAVRSDIDVKAGSSTLLNLMTIVKYSKATKLPDGKEQLEYKSDDLKSETLESKSTAGQLRRLQVRYLRRAASKELAEYQGRRDYRQNAPASISFGAISIYADSITIEKPAMHVQAVGHVIIEDGTQRRQGNEATVEFDAPDPVATLSIRGQSSSR
jgi:hypothetical protein